MQTSRNQVKPTSSPPAAPSPSNNKKNTLAQQKSKSTAATTAPKHRLNQNQASHHHHHPTQQQQQPSSLTTVGGDSYHSDTTHDTAHVAAMASGGLGSVSSQEEAEEYSSGGVEINYSEQHAVYNSPNYNQKFRSYQHTSPSAPSAAVAHARHCAAAPTTTGCYGCGMKSGLMGSNCCSRRCAWLVNFQCPQCGKSKPDTGYVYCSRHCIYQSSQANWCSTCGVCQTDLSGFCVNQQCAGAFGHHHQHNSSCNTSLPPGEISCGFDSQMMMLPNSFPSPAFLVPGLSQGCHQSGNGGRSYHGHRSGGSHHNGGRNAANKTDCCIMNSSDMARSGLPAIFSAICGSSSSSSSAHGGGGGARIIAAIKLTASATHRKHYLSHRSIVENQMAAQGMSKYGHGGEGNEQRRFFGVPLQCNLGCDINSNSMMMMGSSDRSSSTASSRTNGTTSPTPIGGAKSQYHQDCNSGVSAASAVAMPSLRTCYDPSCSACCVLNRGFDLNAMNVASHYSNTTAAAATQFLQPSPNSGLKALVVARVVIGNPELHLVDAHNEPPSFIQAPQDPSFHHSMILTNNCDASCDGTHVFSDDAVDPQYLILFE